MAGAVIVRANNQDRVRLYIWNATGGGPARGIPYIDQQISGRPGETTVALPEEDDGGAGEEEEV